MGSSWVSLGQEIPEDKQNEWVGVHYGFWVKDSPLLVWLSALCEIIDETPDVPAWLAELRNEWSEAYGGVGCVYSGLQDHVTDDNRREVLLAVVLKALERLLEQAGDYERAFPSTKRWNVCVEWGGMPVELKLGEKIGLIEVGANFARLLSGEVRSGEHSPQAWGRAPDSV